MTLTIFLSGHSAVYDVLGESLVFRRRRKGRVVTIDKKTLIETRERLPFLKDIDKFTLSN